MWNFISHTNRENRIPKHTASHPLFHYPLEKKKNPDRTLVISYSITSARVSGDNTDVRARVDPRTEARAAARGEKETHGRARDSLRAKTSPGAAAVRFSSFSPHTRSRGLWHISPWLSCYLPRTSTGNAERGAPRDFRLRRSGGFFLSERGKWAIFAEVKMDRFAIVRI